jgi:Na+/phosphate symporter
VIIALILLCIVVGVLMYLLSADPKRAEVGRILFFCGMLALLLGGAEKLVALFTHS